MHVFTAIECKLAELPGRSAAEGFAALGAFYGPRAVARAFVACRTAHRHRLRDDPRVEAVSVEDLMGLIVG